MKQILRMGGILGVLVCIASSGVDGKTLKLIKDPSEELLLKVPTDWIIGSEDAGSDFITHAYTIRDPDDTEHVRLGWFNTPQPPESISDATIELFKSRVQDWLESHKKTGIIKGDQELQIGEKQAYFVRVELTEDGITRNVDFFLVLGTKALYVLSVTHCGDKVNAELAENLGQVIVANPVEENQREAAEVDAEEKARESDRSDSPAQSERYDNPQVQSSDDRPASLRGSFIIIRILGGGFLMALATVYRILRYSFQR